MTDRMNHDNAWVMGVFGAHPPAPVHSGDCSSPETTLTLGRNSQMSALGHGQTSRHARVMSDLTFKADIRQRIELVRLVPQADIEREPNLCYPT